MIKRIPVLFALSAIPGAIPMALLIAGVVKYLEYKKRRP